MTTHPSKSLSAAAAAYAAARNNAEWCDIFCRTHGITGEFHEEMWTSAGRTPPFYPDAVTLLEGVSPDILLSRIDTLSTGCSVKDSFADLDLSAFGFRVLFDAEWIYRQPGMPAPSPSTGTPWQQVRDPALLSRWEAAWSGGAEPTGLFRPELLQHAEVEVLARVEGELVVAGTILTRSESVAGVSNLFTTRGDPGAAWTECLAAAAERFPGTGIVGYQAGEELAAAHDVGFLYVGPLRVWMAESD